MPPPPVTPSARRFIVKKEPAPVRRTPLTQSHNPRPSTQHFNSTPRFTFPSTPHPVSTQQVSTQSPTIARFATPIPKKEVDVIEDLSDDLPYDVYESIEHDDDRVQHEDGQGMNYGSTDDYDNDNEDNIKDERTPKRRRLTSAMLLDDEEENIVNHEETKDEELPTSSNPSLPSPRSKRPTSSHHNHHQKFVVNIPGPVVATPQPPTVQQSPFIKPPRFLAPEPSEIAAFDPLPDHFSPHRKGQKYLPGGMASELRDWLTNISSSIPPQKDREDPWAVRLLIDEMSGGSRSGMTMVRGRQVHHMGTMVDNLGLVRCVLAGEGMGVGIQKGAKVEVGRTVGIMGPLWEMVVNEQKWGVGVEWKVLN